MATQAVYQPTLQQIVEHIVSSRRITRQDQQLLLSHRDLTSEEHFLINKVFNLLKKGLLKVVD